MVNREENGPVGFLHPGAMGAALATACAGNRSWVSAGRAQATRQRAKKAGLTECKSLEEITASSSLIVSICPPDAAETVAERVAATGFDGIYLDANAIAPPTSRRIGKRFNRYVDGGIIGPPPATPGTTRLYLSGEEAAVVSDYWATSVFDVIVIDGGAGAASAVKACFAAWTKGSAALLVAIRALAESEGVTDAIVHEWETSMPDLLKRADHTATTIGPKAWRFAGEMDEIAAAFAAHDLPSGFHTAAAELYRKLEGFKDRSPGPSLSEVITALGDPKNR